MEEIRVHVSAEMHRRLELAASARGLSLSDFMAERAARVVDRPATAERMARSRASISGSSSAEERRRWRDEGRR